jgi:hypothetical protein
LNLKTKKLLQTADVTHTEATQVSTDDNILADGMDAAFRSLIRNSATGLVRSGVLSDDLPADALAMNEPAVAFNYNMPIGAQENQTIITRADIEELVLSIQQRLQNLPTDKLAEIRANLLMNVGAAKTNFSEIVTQAMNQALAASDDVVANKQPATEQQLHNMMNAYKDMGFAAREELAERGYSDTKENDEKLHKLWDQLSELKPGSEEWNNARNEIYKMDNDFFARVEEEATARGDHKTAAMARDFRKDAETRQKEIDTEIDSVNVKAEKGNNADVALTEEISEDDESKLVQRKSSPNPIQLAKQDGIDIGNLAAPQTPGNNPAGGRGMA